MSCFVHFACTFVLKTLFNQTPTAKNQNIIIIFIQRNIKNRSPIFRMFFFQIMNNAMNLLIDTLRQDVNEDNLNKTFQQIQATILSIDTL